MTSHDDLVDRGTIVRRAEQTRRSLLGKASVAAVGGLAVAAVAGPEAAYGTSVTGWKDVKDLGATGDGSTDDRPAIQSAIDSAKGQLCYFPPGTYMIGAPLVLPSNTHLLGVGKGSSASEPGSVIKALSGNTGQLIVNKGFADPTKAGNDNITIESLELDGNRQARPSVLAEVIRIEAPSGQSCNRISLRNLYVHDSMFGISLHNWVDGEIVGCHIWELVRDGIHGEEANQYVRCIGNRLYDMGDDMIAFHAASAGSTATPLSQHITVVGNICGPGKIVDPSRWTGSGSGITLSGVKNGAIVGNTIQESFQYGIQLKNAEGTACENVTVEGNVIADVGKSLATGQAHGIVVSGAFPGYSQAASEGVRRVILKGNVIVNPKTHGIILECWSPATVDHIVVEGNLVYWSAPVQSWVDQVGNGMVVAPYGTTSLIQKVGLEDNVVFNPQVHGINCDAGTSVLRDLVVARNREWNGGFQVGSSVIGIRVINVKNVRISENIATDDQTQKTQGYGLQVQSPKGVVFVHENDFSGNVNAPSVSGTSGADQLRLRDNVGWSPWTGSDATSSAWSQIGTTQNWKATKTFSFPIPFPSPVTPKVYVSTKAPGFSAAVTTVNNTSVTVTVTQPAVAMPSGAASFDWEAEPA